MTAFSLEPAQLAWCAELRALAAERLRPLAEKGEPGRVNRALVAELGRLGLLGRLFTSGALDLCLMRESLAYACTEAETALALQGLGAHPLHAHGTQAQRTRWLPRVADGSAIAAFALSEPGAGSDAAALGLRAEREGPPGAVSGGGGGGLVASGGGARDAVVSGGGAWGDGAHADDSSGVAGSGGDVRGAVDSAGGAWGSGRGAGDSSGSAGSGGGVRGSVDSGGGVRGSAGSGGGPWGAGPGAGDPAGAAEVGGSAQAAPPSFGGEPGAVASGDGTRSIRPPVGGPPGAVASGGGARGSAGSGGTGGARPPVGGPPGAVASGGGARGSAGSGGARGARPPVGGPLGAVASGGGARGSAGSGATRGTRTPVGGPPGVMPPPAESPAYAGLDAAPDGPARWRLVGEKCWISNAPEADFYTVFARTTPGAGARGVTAFLVPADRPGLTGSGLDMLSPHPIGALEFDAVPVTADDVLGEVDRGFRVAMGTLNLFRPSVGAFAVGMAQAALDATLDHTSRRDAFGGKLRDLQAVSHQVAEMALRTEAARLMVYAAATAYDEDAPDVPRRSAMAKLLATETAQYVVDTAVQLHGARALQRGHLLEHLYREVRAPRIYEGASEVQRGIIAKELYAHQEAR